MSHAAACATIQYHFCSATGAPPARAARSAAAAVSNGARSAAGSPRQRSASAFMTCRMAPHARQTPCVLRSAPP